MRDNGEFTRIEIHEGTNQVAGFVLHPDTHGGSVRVAIAPFGEHVPVAWALVTAASALSLPPDIQVRLIVLCELLGRMEQEEDSTGDTDDLDDPSIPF